MAQTDDTIAKIMARSGATREDASLALKRSGGDANKALMSLINQSAASPSPTSAGVNAQNYSHGAKSKRAHRPMTDDDDIVVRPEVPQREYAQGAFASKQNDNGEHHSLVLRICGQELVSTSPFIVFLVSNKAGGKHSSPKSGTGSSARGNAGPSSASTSQNDPTAPGAVGVDGPHLGNNNLQPYSSTFGNSTPVEAQVVADNQDEFQSLQEQVRQQQQALEELRRNQQTVVVGELMTDDEEAQYANPGKDEPRLRADASVSEDSTPHAKPSTRNGNSKVRWIVIGVGVLAVIIIAIVLAIVFSAAKDECTTETEALQSTAQIQNVNDAWNAEFTSLFNDPSVCNITGNSGTCTFDSKSLSSHEEYLSACTQVGGSPQTYSDAFRCSFQNNGENFQIEYLFVDVPECIASSCDQAAGQALVSDLVASFGNQFDCL
jgi:hypothetical protein